MRIETGYRAYLLDSLIRNHRMIKYAIEKFKGSAYLSLEPSIGLVERKGLRYLMAIPQLTIFMPETIPFKDPDFILAEDVWVNAKVLPDPMKLLALGKPFKKLLTFMREGIVEDAIISKPSCYLIGISSSMDSSTYLEKIINQRHVIILTGLKDLTPLSKRISGRLFYYWSTHPVLSNVHLNNSEIDIIPISSLRKLKYLVKPLLYLDSEIVMGEIEFNSSIIFAGYSQELEELLFRAVLYTC
jgi:hypothetical protein